MKKIGFLIVYLFFSLILLSNVWAKASEYDYFNLENLNLDVKANHLLLYNLKDEKVVYQKGYEDKISIASLTKIMTAMVVIENNEDLDKIVTIPKEAFYNTNGYAMAGFKMNEKVTIRDLLYGTLLPSGVEAAQALAVLTGGNLDNFVVLMNELKDKIGMNATHFSNPVGRDDENNYSTLEDLKKLILYALQNEAFETIYTTRYYKTTNHLELYSTLVGPSEKYHLNVGSIKGSKSGFTKDAGLCLSSLYEFDDVEYLLILAGSMYQNGFPNHIVDSLEIYNYFNEHYDYINVLEKDRVLAHLKVQDATLEDYFIKSSEDVSFYLEKEIKDFSYQYEGIEVLNRKIKQNDFLGKVKVFYKENLLYSYDVYLDREIKYNYTDYKIMGIVLVFLIICLFSICKLKKRKRKKRIKI